MPGGNDFASLFVWSDQNVHLSEKRSVYRTCRGMAPPAAPLALGSASG